DMRARVFTLAAGQCIPWHYHSEVTDSFVCLTGRLVVETRAPHHTYELAPGERCAVPPMTAHFVHGPAGDNGTFAPVQFHIVQGVGSYDFVPVGGARGTARG
ncbi:MAG: cupin domain-containing protein, partial [Pseudomonadota bacterium]